MINKIRYRLQRGFYSLAKKIGLMTVQEYDVEKYFLRQKFPHDPENRTIGSNTGSWLKRDFGKYFDQNYESLPEKYLHLLRDLDEESCSIIQTTLARLMKHRRIGIGGWGHVRFKATAEEIIRLKTLEDEFHSRIIRFPNGILAYKNWLLPFGKLNEEAFLHKHFIEELRNLKKIRDMDILDVGGFIGDSALVLQDYTEKNVYSFDPNPANIAIMLETKRLNNSSKIIPVPLGLGDKNEKLFMSKGHPHGGEGFIKDGVIVNVTTLDEWVEQNMVQVGLIKVDIEGYEQKFLAGALQTIKRHRPALLLSIYHNAADFFEIKPFLESLNLGYSFKIRRPVANNVTETTLICEAT